MIFRKVALERLSSPEQLDQLVQVTDPRGWLALTGLGALLLAAAAWGFWGSIPTLATGGGMLVRQGGVADLVANANGEVAEVLVSVGEVIAKGQPVARLRQDALLRQIQDNGAKLAAQRGEYESLLRSADEQRRLRGRGLAQQRADLERTVETLEKDVALLRERVDAERALLDDGLVTKQTLLTTQQSLNAKRDDLAARKQEVNGLELKGLEADQALAQQLEARRGGLRDLDLQTRELQAQLRDNVEVRSPFAGRVLEVLADRGDVVAPGKPILSVEVLSQDLMAVLFVPAAVGKKVLRGMEVRVAPSTVKREEFGTLLGRVEWVAEFPSTARGMTRFLGNEALVARLMTEGPPIQINVALRRDPATPTGYRWSSSRGPTLKISSGTLATGDVVVRQERPIGLVVPALRQRLGL